MPPGPGTVAGLRTEVTAEGGLLVVVVVGVGALGAVAGGSGNLDEARMVQLKPPYRPKAQRPK